MTVESLGDSEEDRARWRALAESSSNIFSTPEWADVWWTHFGVERELDVRVVRDESGRDLAVLPLCHETHFGVGITRFVGHGVADQLGPVCMPDETARVAPALRQAANGSEVLFAERLAADRDWNELGGSVLRHEASPVISNANLGGWEEYLEGRSANFRQQARRRARRVARELDLRYRLAGDGGDLDGDLDILFALHTARWGEVSDALAGPRQPFHREFAAVALRRGWLRLWVAESNGQPVAAWYGFRFAGVESYYQSGRDPNWERHGVGTALLEHSIREAFNDGMAEYRLLRGDESYKQRYATGQAGVDTRLVPKGPLGRSAAAAVTMLAQLSVGQRLLGRLMHHSADDPES